MGQQPNIELDPEDRPRATLLPSPPRRWRPSMRPGMITAPDEMPEGIQFGVPAPDTGYALRLIALDPEIPDRSPELEAVLAALMAARASRFGRAPTKKDLQAAKLLCGIGEGLPPELAERRERWVDSVPHDPWPGAGAVAEAGDVLYESPEHVRYILTR